MTKGRILLKLIMDEIGLGKLELDTFSKRLNLQKRIYLLQLTGLDLRYRYNWYLRGPYCPSLTQDAFLLRDEVDSSEDDYERYELSNTAKKKIEKAKEIWKLALTENVCSNDWVELLASLHYLKYIAYWPANDTSRDKIFQKLIEAKPKFIDKHQLIEKAWRRLTEIGLIHNKTLA